MSYKILLPQPVAQEAVDWLQALGYTVKHGTGISEEAMCRDVVDCDAILLRTAECTRAVLEAGSKLKIVARHGAGYNNIDLRAAEELGIWATNTPDATTNSVAEFTLGATIAAAKRTREYHDAVRRNDFDFKFANKGTDLMGKTLGIVGFGRIGQAVAKRAYYGLGMKIIAYTPHPDPARTPDYVQMMDRDAVFANADFISLHMPLKQNNRRSIGQREFERMKPTAYLINCARGEVVDQDALTNALRTRRIAGAFLDVLESEPYDPSWPILQLENAYVTPHVASNTTECMRTMACQAAQQIHKVLSGQEPDWPVNHIGLR